MAIVKARTNKNFNSTLGYVTRKSAGMLFANVPQALGDGEICQEVSASMEAQAQKSRCEKPCYHISISPQQEDLPVSRKDWYSLIKKFLTLTGMNNHQAVAFLHEDTTYPDGTERPHAHLVVNRVGDRGRAIDTSWDYYRFQTTMRVLEEQFEWEHQPCSWEVDKRRDTPGQVQRLQRERAEYERGERSEPPTPAMRSQLADAVERAIAESTTMQGIEQFLKPLGIEVHHHLEKDKLGWSFECDGFHFAGYQLGRNLSQWSVNKKQNLERLELKKQAPLTAIQDGEVQVRCASSSDNRHENFSGIPIDYTLVFNSSDEDGSTKFATFKADGDWVVETAEDRRELTADDDLEATAISSQSDDLYENFSGVPTAAMIAQTLVNYAKSRASFYKDIDYTEPIPSTLGTISVQADSDDTLVSICDEDNSTKFAAFKIDGDWVVQTDELINSERKRIQSVPQTPEDYVVQAHGKCVMDALLKMDEAKRDHDGLHLQGENGSFDYYFDIDRNADGDVQVVGFDSSQSEEIFKASRTDGAMNIHHCQIPRDTIDAISSEADDRAKKQPAPRQRELTPPRSTPEL